MARPITFRNTSYANIPVKTSTPGIELVPKPLWSPPLGLDYLSRVNRVDDQHATQIKNMWLDRGVLRSRYGTNAVGDAATGPVMVVLNFIIGSGIGFLIRFTTTKLQIWNGTVWENVGSATFTGGTNDYFAYTAFNNMLIFSNGVDGMWEYSPATGALTLIPGAPNAKHLTTFGGRIIASAVNGEEHKIQWPAKNNSRAWAITDAGSGYEDLLSTPGGQIDQVIGVYPLSDTVALMLRTNSVWHMSQTGDPDAPFRFERLYHKLGCRSRNSVDVIPGGLVFLGLDGIYMLNEQTITPIGQLVHDVVLSEFADLGKVRGVYRPRTHDYWLASGDTVYRYSFVDKGWSRSVYPFTIRWMDESVFHYEGITWDQMVGSWDEQTLSWDQLLGDSVPSSMYFSTSEANGMVIAENPIVAADGYIQDGYDEQGIELRSGQLIAGSIFQDVEIVELWMDYEAGSEQPLVFEFSDNKGATWHPYSTKITELTDKPDVLRCMKNVTRQSLMIRVTSEELGLLVVGSLVPFIVTSQETAHRPQGTTGQSSGGGGGAT